MARSIGFGSNWKNYKSNPMKSAYTLLGLSRSSHVLADPSCKRYAGRVRFTRSPSTDCSQRISVSISLPRYSLGFFSPFPHGTCTLSVIEEYLGLEGGTPFSKVSCDQNSNTPRFTGKIYRLELIYRAITFFGQIFQSVHCRSTYAI